MDQLFFLILLNLSIGFGSYIAGTIPILFYLSETKVRLFSVFGAGILIGAALCVIIPEGISSIYQTGVLHKHLKHHHIQERSLNSSDVIKDFTEAKNVDDHSNENNDPHSVIGLTLLIGFIAMLIVDQISSSMTGSNSSNTGYSQLSTSNDNSIKIEAESDNHHHHSTGNKKISSQITATIGLIVHSAADGIALGAAATTSHADVEMIVFLAILLHKAPAAFGLVTFLLHEGLDRNRTRRHLFWFSISAPLSSFLTYFFINQSSQQQTSFHEYNATGISLLFSAGTFLYVATVHVLPEIIQHHRLKLKELLLLIGGSFLPSVLTIKHHH